MKKIMFLALACSAALLCSCRSGSSDKSGSSDLDIAKINSQTSENLEVICRVWGFAKYHHPVFSKSETDADQELFKLLGKAVKVTPEKRNKILERWIGSLGEFEYAPELYEPLLQDQKPELFADLSWTADSALLGESLPPLLSQLRFAKRTAPNHYFTGKRSHGSYTDFSNEKKYEDCNELDSGYRLLGLFRCWNIVEYFFPSRNLCDKDWNDVLTEYIPVFAAAASYEEYHRAVAALISEIDDSHSYCAPSVFEGRRTPLGLKFIGGRLIVTHEHVSKKQTQLLPGDEIVSYDGRTISEIMDEVGAYVSCSNRASLERNTIFYGLQSNAPSLDVKYMRDGIPGYATVNGYAKAPVPNADTPAWKMLEGNVGYIWPAKFKIKDSDDIMKMFRNAKGIVVDMRCYPSDFMVFDFIGRYFVPEKTSHVIFTHPVLELPGCFYVPEDASIGDTNPGYYKGKVVVIVNEQTQSNAEYTVMTFQACPNTTVIGSQTAGADGNVTRFSFPGGIETCVSGLGVFYPDGTNTQRTGVRIDEYVYPTVEGIKSGRDELLERAIQIIRQ